MLLSVIAVLGSPARAQCVLSENGITVELLGDGLNEDGTFSYVWSVQNDAQNAHITNAYFQRQNDAPFSNASVTRSDPSSPTGTHWTALAGAFPNTQVSAVHFRYDSGVRLRQGRTFIFRYTTAFQDPVRVLIERSDGAVFDEFFFGSTCGVLPVELTAFDALIDQNAVTLQWTTASETNNAGFEVQHAAGAGAFEAVSFVAGAGTTVAPQQYSLRLTDLAPGRHRFRLKQVDFDGAHAYSGVVEAAVELPGKAFLSAAYPNPFNPQTQFTLTIARQQQVQVAVYDLAGRRVATLHDGALGAGEAHAFTFRAGSLPSGVYFYHAQGEDFTLIRQMLLVK